MHSFGHSDSEAVVIVTVVKENNQYIQISYHRCSMSESFVWLLSRKVKVAAGRKGGYGLSAGRV